MPAPYKIGEGELREEALDTREDANLRLGKGRDRKNSSADAVDMDREARRQVPEYCLRACGSVGGGGRTDGGVPNIEVLLRTPFRDWVIDDERVLVWEDDVGMCALVDRL